MKAAAFKINCQNFFKELLYQYPGINIYLKLHLTDRHLHLAPTKYGFCGRANEQGSESFHVRLNKISSVVRSRKGAQQFAAAVQKKIRMGELSKIGCIVNTFENGRMKFLDRKKETQLVSKKTPVMPEILKVQEKSTITYERKEYTRHELVKCSLCNKKFPTALTIHHLMFFHSIINVGTIEEFSSLEEADPAPGPINNNVVANGSSSSSSGTIIDFVNQSDSIDVATIYTTPKMPANENLGVQTQETQFDCSHISPRENLTRASKESTSARHQAHSSILLSEEEDHLVRKALYGEGQNDDIMAIAGTDSVQRQSIRKLRPGIWLNDEIVNCYFTLLAKRDTTRCLNAGKLRSYFLKSFFFSHLLENGREYNYNNVKTWSRGSDIFAFNKVFAPVNINNTHWALVVASMQQNQIQYEDPFHGDGKAWVETFFRYLEDEHMDKKKIPLPNKESWKLITCKSDCPKQENNWDCGVFCCAFADFLSRDQELNFGQSYVTDYRKKIALSIMKGCI